MKITEIRKNDSKEHSVSAIKSRKSSSAVKRNRHIAAEKRMSVLSPKRKRQYKHILISELKEGRSLRTAERIAMASTNKSRKLKGETRKADK